MRKIYNLLFLLFVSSLAVAQVSVTATLATPGPTNYSNVKAAFDAINSGLHRGSITIEVTGTTIETTRATINASGTGSALYNAITIKPAGGASAISGDVAGALIDLNGADNVTIDGLNTGGNSLTISNSNSTAGAEVCTIRFTNDATNNLVSRVTISGANVSTASGTVLFGTGTATGNDDNTISNCTIADVAGGNPVNGIYSLGNVTPGVENSGNTISGNHVANFFHPDLGTAGILLAGGNTDWLISANRLFQTAARTFTTAGVHRAIQITSGNNYRILGNIIGYSSAAGTGTYILGGSVATRFLAIDLAVGTSPATSVQGNVITSFSFATTHIASSASGIWSAINITSGNVNVGTETGNMVGSTSGTGNIFIQPQVAGTLTVGITSSSAGDINISNNLIGSITVQPTGVLSGNLLGIQTQGAGGTVFIRANTIGNTETANMRVGLPGTTTGNGIVRGILNSNMGVITIVSNTIRNLTHNSNNALALFRGIECQQGEAIISANNITNLSANGTSTSVLLQEGVGILFSTGSPGGLITDNTITSLNVVNASAGAGTVVSGIYLSSAIAGTTITRNKIYGFSNASTASSPTTPGVICGIYCRDASTSSALTIANNMISFGANQTTNTAIIGIWNQVASAANYTEHIYYNSINITGIVITGAQPSFGFYRGDFTNTAFTTPNVQLRNNIITNTRGGGTGKHYTLSNSYPSLNSSATGWVSNASDNNVLVANPGTIGYWSGDRIFEAWQSISAGDANSVTGVTVNYIDPLSDLHLVPSRNAAIDNKGAPIAGQIRDFDNELRNAVTPDPGADEFTFNALSVSVEYFKGRKLVQSNQLAWKASCTASEVLFDVERSANGRVFEIVGSIRASRERCAQPFDFTDSKPLSGLNHYRLKMTEIDGGVYYSPMVSIGGKTLQPELTRFSPTLLENNVGTLTTYSEKAQTLTVIVNDLSGKLIHRQLHSAAEGINQVRLTFSNLPAGVYPVRVCSSDGNCISTRFIKQ
ncbi:hypothetical protein EXU57_05620 [Segetibacter sp. 3557_3]|uniref:hypothetical protein n=1 Tax=Segetibacter sp. 3557_3 TaxID=2547429 RepID=UPI00105853A0|nr:hypothetical protein [Segetibacter sp. 3557_3]TDH27944.1 hypothetical protein EXU57_05620 [Segetibacter sp. 3557_3]